MNVFDRFIEKEGKIVDDSWAKWFHFAVPDEEGEKRKKIKDRLFELGHCKECLALSVCYFVNYKKLNLLLRQNLCKI